MSGALVPLTLAPFIGGVLNPVLDSLLCASILVHSHIGFQAILIDYIPVKRMPNIRRFFMWGLNAATVLVGIGLYEFETSEQHCCVRHLERSNLTLLQMTLVSREQSRRSGQHRFHRRGLFYPQLLGVVEYLLNVRNSKPVQSRIFYFTYILRLFHIHPMHQRSKSMERHVQREPDRSATEAAV